MITIGNEKLDAFINEELEKKLKELHKTDPLEMFWNYNDYLSQDQIAIILSDDDGWNTIENDIIDRNYDNNRELGEERKANGMEREEEKEPILNNLLPEKTQEEVEPINNQIKLF